ncbi:MAG: hypothetical protein DLM73_10610 [Chthoniobacterales bacterium]|nr:MAG: hypothetical protein DLM73_10610 [Chthoniobacterales bacterium]
MNPESLFDRWFAAPIAKLHELPSGDGAFAALIVALPLYERAIIGTIKLRGHDSNEDAIKAEVEADLHIDLPVRARFWSVFRNGFMHQAMGLDGHTKWLVSAEFTAIPTLISRSGNDYLCLDPWKFAERTITKFKERPELITASESFPFATILEHNQVA